MEKKELHPPPVPHLVICPAQHWVADLQPWRSKVGHTSAEDHKPLQSD